MDLDFPKKLSLLAFLTAETKLLFFHFTFVSSINFHTFDEDLVNELPSCLYVQGGHGQHLNNPNNGLNSNNLRQIQHQYLHHSG